MTDNASAEPESSAPADVCVEGSSFSMPLKVLATGLMLAFVFWTAQVIGAGAWAQWSSEARVLLMALMALMGGSYWGILTSRTRIDSHAIRQSWLWPKEAKLADLTQVKLIHIPGLSWLIAPRLMVRAGGLTMTTFHAGDPTILAAFRRLAYGHTG